MILLLISKIKMLHMLIIIKQKKPRVINIEILLILKIKRWTDKEIKIIKIVYITFMVCQLQTKEILCHISNYNSLLLIYKFIPLCRPRLASPTAASRPLPLTGRG